MGAVNVGIKTIPARLMYLMSILNLKKRYREVVVAQLVEQLLSIPEVCGSNPVIGKNLFIH